MVNSSQSEISPRDGVTIDVDYLRWQQKVPDTKEKFNSSVHLENEIKTTFLLLSVTR